MLSNFLHCRSSYARSFYVIPNEFFVSLEINLCALIFDLNSVDPLISYNLRNIYFIISARSGTNNFGSTMREGQLCKAVSRSKNYVLEQWVCLCIFLFSNNLTSLVFFRAYSSDCVRSQNGDVATSRNTSLSPGSSRWLWSIYSADVTVLLTVLPWGYCDFATRSFIWFDKMRSAEIAVDGGQLNENGRQWRLHDQDVGAYVRH